MKVTDGLLAVKKKLKTKLCSGYSTLIQLYSGHSIFFFLLVWKKKIIAVAIFNRSRIEISMYLPIPTC